MQGYNTLCGQIHLINRETNTFKHSAFIKLFTQGLYCTALRGTDGTGVLSATRLGNMSVYKRDLAPADFLEMSKAKQVIEGTDNVFLMGHARASTVGHNSNENSHPFSRGHIHLYHNGTLRNHSTLHNLNDVRVDSDAIAAAISACNSREAIVQVLESLVGAFSLAWYDSDAGTINFARNEERPLYRATFKDSKSELFCSESGMIIWLAGRSKDIELEKVEETKIGSFITINMKGEEEITTFTPKETLTYGFTGEYGYYTTYSRRGVTVPVVIEKESTSKKPSIDATPLKIVKLDKKNFTKNSDNKSAFSFKAVSNSGIKVTLNVGSSALRNKLIDQAKIGNLYVACRQTAVFTYNRDTTISCTYVRPAVNHEVAEFYREKESDTETFDESDWGAI